MYLHLYMCMHVRNVYCYIIGSTTLKVLEVGYNNFSDDGILMISEELQGNNCLINLSTQNCGLSVEGKELTMTLYSL